MLRRKVCLLDWITVPAILAAAILNITQSARAQALGQASNYNVYVLTNDTASGDSGGAVAVGGNATFTQYSVGSSLATGSSPNLVVGGTLNATGATVNGSVYANTLNYSDPSVLGNVIGNNVNLSSYGTISGSVSYGSSYSNATTGVSGSVTKAPYTSPINFASTNSSLLSKSSTWSNLAATGTTVDYYNGITCTGASSTLNVFNITGTQLSSENNLVINAPAGSTVVVNISGTSDTWSGGLSLSGGVTSNDVIYNFYQATNLAISGISVDGSILAAGAAVNFNSGQVHGNLIAGSLSGSGEAHNGDDPGNTDLFAGTLPNGGQIAITPEPSSSVALILGLGMAAGLATKRKKGALTTLGW